MFTFYVLLVLVFGASGTLLSANPGHNVTLPCFYDSSAKNLCWYKQVAGEKPQIVSSFYKYSPDSNKFHNQFQDKRFSVRIGKGFYHLNIFNIRDSDSAMYYCGHTTGTVTEFNNGTFLVLKESSRRTFLQQPASDSVKPGKSVTLNCTLHTGTSDTEHSVYWFKRENSRNSHLGIMYIDTHSVSQCEQSLGLEFPARSCVHTLTKRNASVSDTGTYYCAVALCGDILFGKGTRLDVGEKQDDISPVFMNCMVAALLVSVFLNITLIGILCKMSRRKRSHSEELQPHSSVPENTANSQSEESDAPQYVAVDFKEMKGKSRRWRSTEEETIYSGVKLSELN
ncbi:uncharacterized protein LOC144534508 [Sander vitreus]